MSMAPVRAEVRPRPGPSRVLRAAGMAFTLAVSLLATGPPALATDPAADELGAAARPAGLAAVSLGTASGFAVLAGTPAIANTGPTIITGDLGIDPSPTVAGFPSGTVNGTIHRADAIAQQAQHDLVTAYADAAARPVTATYAALGGLTLAGGVYNAGGVTLDVTGILILDGKGDSSAAWVFQAGSDLVTAPSSSVKLVNGADACNVFWQVAGTATFGPGSTFAGTVLALASITMGTGVTVTGRALALNGPVTLTDDTITAPGCAAPAPGTLTGATGATGPVLPVRSTAADTAPTSERSPVAPIVAIMLVVLAAILGAIRREPRSAGAGAGRGWASGRW